MLLARGLALGTKQLSNQARQFEHDEHPPFFQLYVQVQACLILILILWAAHQ